MNLGIILNAGTCFRNENTFSLSTLYRFLTSTNNFIYRTFIRVRWCGFFFYIKEVVLLHYIQHECFNWIWRLCVSKWSTFFFSSPELSWRGLSGIHLYVVSVCIYLSTFDFYLLSRTTSPIITKHCIHVFQSRINSFTSFSNKASLSLNVRWIRNTKNKLFFYTLHFGRQKIPNVKLWHHKLLVKRNILVCFNRDL